MYIRIRESIIIGIIISMIGLIYIIRELDKLNIWVGTQEIGISISIMILYNIINKWIKGNKEMEIIIIINIIGILLFINNNKEIGLIYIILELYTMTMYIIINYNNNEIKGRSIKNNIIYFFINSISSLFLLLIICIIYYHYGIIYIQDYIYINDTIIYNILIIIILFKLGVYPFYYWIIRIYKGFDIKILLFQSIFSKFIYLYFFISLPLFDDIYTYIIILSIINLIYISIIGINSKGLKEILIISSLLNQSFLLFASFSPFLFIYYFILYIINTFLIFYFLLNPSPLYYINHKMMKGGNHIYIFLILLFSLIGFPPFGGFFIKLYIIFNSFNFGLLISYPFIFIIIIASLISANFYLKIINYFFTTSPLNSFLHYTPVPPVYNIDIEENNIEDPKEWGDTKVFGDKYILISFFSLFISFFYFFHPYYFYIIYFIL